MRTGEQGERGEKHRALDSLELVVVSCVTAQLRVLQLPLICSLSHALFPERIIHTVRKPLLYILDIFAVFCDV